MLLVLPPEVLITIFTYQTSLCDLLSLASTSKDLQAVWKTHLYTIISCGCMLPQTISSYRDAARIASYERYLRNVIEFADIEEYGQREVRWWNVDREDLTEGQTVAARL